MDREKAKAAARAYLTDCIELEPIPEEEVKNLNLYWFGGHRSEYHFFYYKTSGQPLKVGSSSWVAVSKKTGMVAGTGEVGE